MKDFHYEKIRYPYPGLRPFKRHETEIFFGRQQQINQLIDKLGDSHFIAVVGRSGCGKSSLVRTGMLAGLEAGFLAKAGVRWKTEEFRPSSEEPLIQLSNRLLEKSFLDEKYLGDFENNVEFTEKIKISQETLKRNPSKIQKMLKSTLECNLLILVDQFEELFRYFDKLDSQQPFVSLLLESCKHQNIYVVITMRTDFMEQCALFHKLPEAINAGLFLVPRLDTLQLREVIEFPAPLFNGEVHPDLVRRLVDDMGNDLDQLPLMQHALMRMWQLASTECQEEEKIVLTLAHYQEIGNLSQALSKNADQAYENLEPTQQKIAKILFLSLTNRDSNQRDIRRPTSLTEIVTLTAHSTEEVIEVIKVFQEQGRNFIMPSLDDSPSPNTVLDISHESLIWCWSRLEKWVEEEKKHVETYSNLKRKAHIWEDTGKSEIELESGYELKNALKLFKSEPIYFWENWAKRYDKEEKEFKLAQNFLEMSEQYDKRRRKSKILKNIIIIGGVICVILAVSFSFYTQYQSERFKEQKERAEKSEFISKLNYARSAIENEDYKSAKETLEHNPSIVNEFPNLQNIRNLLTWSTELQGATFQREYKEKMLTGGLWTLTIQDHLLATGGDGGTIVIFDTEEAKQLKSLTEHDNTVKSVLFHPFKNQLISAGYDGKVISWSLSNDEPKLLFEAQSPIWTMAINSRGGLIIGERDNTIAFLKMDEDGKEVVFRQKTDGAISKLAISPTGEFLASSSYNRSVQIWKKSLTPQGAEQQQKEIITPTWTNSHSEEVESIAFNPYGTQLASTSRDKTIRLKLTQESYYIPWKDIKAAFSALNLPSMEIILFLVPKITPYDSGMLTVV